MPAFWQPQKLSSVFLSAMDSAGRWMLWMFCVSFTARENAALSVTMKESNLEVVRGDFVVLPCSFITFSRLTRLNIIWTLAPFSSPETPIQVIVYDHGQVIEDPTFTGRVGFTGLPYKADVVLNSTRVSDAGIYRCMVNNPPESADPGIGELMLSVLEAPSLPVCQWDGEMDAGGSVTLSCQVSEGIPTPDIRWHRMNSEEVLYPSNMEDYHSGSVQTVNVSTQTSGLYRCSASNILGTENCYVNLASYTPPQSSSGLLQGVLVTLSMSLVLLALLVLIMWLHRTGQDGRSKEKKSEEDECYNEIRYTPSLMKRSFV